MKPINEIYSLLEQPKKVVITFHQKPDADAMGSGLGLYIVKEAIVKLSGSIQLDSEPAAGSTFTVRLPL